MYFSTKIDHPRIRRCNINRVKYNHKDLITNKKFSRINFNRTNFNFATSCREVHFVKLLFSHSCCENNKILAVAVLGINKSLC